MMSPSVTRWPSCTPSHSSRPVPFDDTDARRAATTRPVAFSAEIDADGYAAATVAISTACGALRRPMNNAIAASSTSTIAQNHHRFQSARRRRGTTEVRSIARRESDGASEVIDQPC